MHKPHMIKRRATWALAVAAMVVLTGCAQPATTERQASQQPEAQQQDAAQDASAQDAKVKDSSATEESKQSKDDGTSKNKQEESKREGPTADELRAELNITEMFYDELAHGEKPADCQKYIVMHDTEGGGTGENVVNYWLSDGRFVSAHFVVGKDGSIVQCVPLDKIGHHAGFGNTGHNEEFGVEDESRDDKRGTVELGGDLTDYGMNSYSIGIEMIHEGETEEDYPAEQLRAVDKIIAYIDAYYGHESKIIDHKTWRLYNSDCSKEFDKYMENYQKTRTHDGSQLDG